MLNYSLDMIVLIWYQIQNSEKYRFIFSWKKQISTKIGMNRFCMNTFNTIEHIDISFAKYIILHTNTISVVFFWWTIIILLMNGIWRNNHVSNIGETNRPTHDNLNSFSKDEITNFFSLFHCPTEQLRDLSHSVSNKKSNVPTYQVNT